MLKLFSSLAQSCYFVPLFPKHFGTDYVIPEVNSLIETALLSLRRPVELVGFLPQVVPVPRLHELEALVLDLGGGPTAGKKEYTEVAFELQGGRPNVSHMLTAADILFLEVTRFQQSPEKVYSVFSLDCPVYLRFFLFLLLLSILIFILLCFFVSFSVPATRLRCHF